jgi:NADPH:quinone reductase-like Zn-dependent oxidoreductase
MKAIMVERFGPAAESARCVDAVDPPPPGPGEVAIRMEAMTINPADLLLIEGRYGTQPKLPLVPGAEGAGVIGAVGAGVTSVAVGDVVIPLVPNCWRERMVLKAASVVKLPAGTDMQQAAMLKANPATAAVLLEDMVKLQSGEWIIQNAANSAVGHYVARLARRGAIKNVSVVRRDDVAEAMRGAGADAVIVHDGADDLRAKVIEATGGAPIRLALDAIGGEATRALARCVAEGGTVVNYGLLSGKPCAIDPQDLVFRDVKLRGFWLTRWFRGTTQERGTALYARLAAMVGDGSLRVPVEASYPLSRISEALAHAAQPGRRGKILLAPG